MKIPSSKEPDFVVSGNILLWLVGGSGMLLGYTADRESYGSVGGARKLYDKGSGSNKVTQTDQYEPKNYKI